MFDMINFFDLKEEDLFVLNPYDFNKSIERLQNLTLEEVRDDLKYFQKKEFEFRNYEEESVYTLDNIEFITSSKNEKGENEFYLLNNLKDYLISDKNLEKINKEKEQKNKENPEKKIIIEIKTQEGGKKSIFLKCYIDPEIFPNNIINNFLDESSFKTANNVKEEFLEKKKLNNESYYFKFTIIIDTISINKIYYNINKGEYYFDCQSPPLFRTNFFVSKDENEEKEGKEDKKFIKDLNCIFPFRNFKDEISNLKYRHFIIKIQKDLSNGTTPRDENDPANTNFDTNDELNNSLENLFKNRNGEIDKDKYISKDIKLKFENKNMKNISDFFDYKNKKEIKRKLKDLLFLKKNDENEKKKEKYNDEEAIKLFYQVLALISECILSYYNGVEFLDNLIFKGKYKDDIFTKCTNEDFPIFFNITLTKILDKYQNSLDEMTIQEFEKEMKSTFDALYARYESEDLEEILKPSNNESLMRVQRCIITPTYILFTPYVLDQGNRILRDFVDSVNDSMLCTFKMDSLEESRWNNKLLIEYIKSIMSRGFFIGSKNFRFFNYSQSQFRNMSCWLLTEPEKILSEIGDFSKIKQVSKFGARISQTLTTTIKTIMIPKDKYVEIDDVENENYTFSDGVGKISVVLSEQISKMLQLDYIPSCFQGRFRGCKGVWTTMWDDKTGQIYCRKSQIKFISYLKKNGKNGEEEENENYYFELCDYSRYIQSYLNRQVITLLSALGIKDEKFDKKLMEYRHKLNDEKFVLSLIYYSEWNQMFQKMHSCGINRINDRLSRSVIESNLDILYSDIKKKARIYVEESAYVIGIMDEFDTLEYGEAYLQIKRDDFSIILDKKCAVAKCPCLHPGDIRVLNFRKYNKNKEETKKYEIFNRYENVIIFPSKGKRPHPDECSGSDLDGDNYFVFYDSDLIPKEAVEPMIYAIKKDEKKDNNHKEFKINDVIEYVAEYTNLNNLGLIGDAHLAICDKEGANCDKAKALAEKFSKAVDAPKTGEKVLLDKEESVKIFPHYMGKTKNKSYQSTNILGKLYDKTCDFISRRKRAIDKIGLFYDEDLMVKGWEKYAFLALIYYRDYFYDLVNLLKKNEIDGESVLLTGNNIDNENSILSKKKHNYDLREKISGDMHNLFIRNKNNFYNVIDDFFCKKNNIKEKGGEKKLIDKLDKKDLINNELLYMNNLNLFASACYMISYNLLESVTLNKKFNKDSSIIYYCNLLEETINYNLKMDNDYQELNEISEYEAMNIGADGYESYEESFNSFFDDINVQKNIIKNNIDKKKEDMLNFEKRLNALSIPKRDPNEENKYRILSFPWCISGTVLTNIKFLNLHYDDE